MMTYDDGFCTYIRTFHRICHAQNTFNYKRQPGRLNVRVQHIGSLGRHFFANNNIVTGRAKNMVNIHADSKSTCIFCKLKLVADFSVISIGLYNPYCFCTRIYD